MDVADAVGDNFLATLGCFVFAATLAAVSATGTFVLLGLALLDGGSVAGTFGTLLPIFAVVALVSTPLAAVALLAVSYALVVRTSAVLGSAMQDRVDDAARAVGRTVRTYERRSTLARFVDLSPVVETLDTRSPETRAQDRIDRVKGRYVEGALSEAEFERRIREVLVDENVSREQVSTLDADLETPRLEVDR